MYVLLLNNGTYTVQAFTQCVKMVKQNLQALVKSRQRTSSILSDRRKQGILYSSPRHENILPTLPKKVIGERDGCFFHIIYLNFHLLFHLSLCIFGPSSFCSLQFFWPILFDRKIDINLQMGKIFVTKSQENSSLCGFKLLRETSTVLFSVPVLLCVNAKCYPLSYLFLEIYTVMLNSANS